MKWLQMIVATGILLVAGAVEASAQGDRFVGVRKDSTDDVILFSIEASTGAERKIATLQKAEAGVQLLGITSLNARRGTFSYAYTDRAAGKDYLHTVSVLTGETVAKIALPTDTSGIEVVADAAKPPSQVEVDGLRRKLEWLEQEVRRLQSQVRPR
jgi:hypothetical protein